MNILNRKVFFLLCTIFLIGCTNKKELFIDYSNSNINYNGRIDSSKASGALLYWSGTSIRYQFEGESISALMEDENGDNYYNVIIDDDSLFVFRPRTIKGFHLLASGLSKGKHSIEIFKRNEWDKGKTSFYGFKINGATTELIKPRLRNRKIEFYGNSVSAGYAMEDTSGRDSPDSTYTNNYLSYGAITARHFNADYHCICKSGIGITVSWGTQIMPEIYDRLDPNDPKSKWDFNNYHPDIVVVNLLQNDSWLVNLPDHEEFKRRFQTKAPDEEFMINAYQEFISNLRARYPKAHIICTLGSMDAAKEGSKWRTYIETAVTNLSDKNIYSHFMPYIKASAHPSIKDHEEMAKSLIGFIEENINW